MKIQTTEAVRRFNAHVELADIALTAPFFNLTDTMSHERLHLQLLAYGHAELAAELRKSAEAIGYSWTDGDGARHSAEPAPMPPINHTKSEDACRHGTCVENDAPDKEHYAWKCADCGYVYGKNEGVDPGTLERARLRSILRLCVARLEEYPDAEGGTALELARRELQS